MEVFNKIDSYHQTRQGKLVFGVAELLLAYAVVSRAIDTGSLWQYLLFVLLFVGGINNLVRVKTGGKDNVKADRKN